MNRSMLTEKGKWAQRAVETRYKCRRLHAERSITGRRGVVSAITPACVSDTDLFWLETKNVPHPFIAALSRLVFLPTCMRSRLAQSAAMSGCTLCSCHICAHNGRPCHPDGQACDRGALFVYASLPVPCSKPTATTQRD